ATGDSRRLLRAARKCDGDLLFAEVNFLFDGADFVRLIFKFDLKFFIKRQGGGVLPAREGGVRFALERRGPRGAPGRRRGAAKGGEGEDQQHPILHETSDLPIELIARIIPIIPRQGSSPPARGTP